jgi:hypothetical protein
MLVNRFLDCHDGAVPPLPDLSALIAEVESRAAGGGDLDHLLTAERVAGDLDALAARLIGYYVEHARAQGSSWAEIGAHLGISKQAAQQRYASQRLRLTFSDLVQAGALVRFTARTRDALTRAEQHADQLGSATVDPQHMLLAILDDTSTLAAQALDRLGADRDALRASLTTPEHPETPDQTGPPPLSSAARRVLDAAVTQALRLQHNYVGTEHLLLAMAHTPADPTGQILATHGVAYDQARAAVRAVIDAYLGRG